MPCQAPISHHVDLYRYWLAKCGSRTMPAKRDIDPADIPLLLPYLGMVQKREGEFRYRLVGTAVVQQFGRDFTGKLVGSNISDKPETVQAMRAITERIFAGARPHFVAGQYETKWGNIHNTSAVVLPLSDGGTQVSVIIFTRIACFTPDVRASTDWLRGAPLKINKIVAIAGIADLENHCLDWMQRCSIGDAAAY
jgi:hypothetical protein